MLDVATRLGRHVVGIDMSDDYVRQVRHYLDTLGAETVTEQTVLNALAIEPKAWSGWNGNKANFRKPGTRRTLDTAHNIV